MKVIDFIKKLEGIGYDSNTELSFSCIDGDTGEWYELHPDNDNEKQDAFTYGEELTGEPYSKDVIDFCLNVDECKDYLYAKTQSVKEDLIEAINQTLYRFERSKN